MGARTHNVHARFFRLRKLLSFDKEEIVWQYSGMLTTSLSEFYAKDPVGYREMITKLEGMVSPVHDEKEVKYWRSCILHRLQKFGVDTTDWNKVNAFLAQPRIIGKPIYKLTVTEMKALVPKLSLILEKENVKQHETKRLTTLN